MTEARITPVRRLVARRPQYLAWRLEPSPDERNAGPLRQGDNAFSLFLPEKGRVDDCRTLPTGHRERPFRPRHRSRGYDAEI